ncbi:lamin tail domain-containing protein [Winogradskyella sp.]|nr:lamin tail domain-containing protein [Winogradskyella sp.]MDB9754904.1 lamin tail domain-containing protein [Winogradskyella sp.]MDC1504604.1 lamin tail domain-containing protein [Winogradskyella sp.]
MNLQFALKQTLTSLGIALVIFSCTTDDIAPSVSLTSDSSNLSEANGILTLTVSLNAAATEQLLIPFIISGTATANNDFTLSANAITINPGNNSGNITITALQDTDVEGEETILISLGSVNNALVLSNTQLTIALQDDDSDSDGDGVLDANDDCPNDVGDPSNNGCPFLGFLINEVNYDPEAGLAGDANGDGTRDANEDEFIEFYNSGPELDLSGYTISDASAVRHTFPAGTIIPVNGVLVVFGGGTPTGDFGGALVQTASEGQINMSNGGDLVTLRDASGAEVLTFDINPLSGNPNESYTRSPDLTGNFVQHASVDAANGALFSPGTRLDGSSL